MPLFLFIRVPRWVGSDRLAHNKQQRGQQIPWPAEELNIFLAGTRLLELPKLLHGQVCLCQRVPGLHEQQRVCCLVVLFAPWQKF